jgi:sugar phosphate isomerase/epimerase
MQCIQKKRLTSLIIVALSIAAIAVFGCSGSQGNNNVKNKASTRDSVTEELGWKIGMQAWSLRSLTFFDMVDTIKSMGLHYLEANTGQKIGGGLDGTINPDMSAELRQKVLDHLRQQGVELVSIGVNVPKSSQEWEQFFAFAKSMGIQTIVSDPDPKFLDLISKLCDQYDINVCIHNNPLPGRRSRNPDTVLADILRVGNSRFGACADIGNWVRAGFDPVQSLKKLQGHVIEVHMKDLLGTAVNAEDTAWGSGNCNIKGVLEELHRQHFKGLISVEDESHPGDNIPEMRKSLEFLYTTLSGFNQ